MKHCRRETEERQLAEARLRQAHKMEAIGTLAGGIAHDFNNILAAIIGFSEMAIDKSPEGSAVRRNMERVLGAGIRGRDLVRQILAFSRQTDQEKEPLKIAPVVREALGLVRASLPSTIDIRTNLQGTLGFVLADRTQIQQIVLNLCTNAAHAMRQTGGAISIILDGFSFSSSEDAPDSTMSPGLYARLSVADTGEGMSAETMEHIFDPFFTTKLRARGRGSAFPWSTVSSRAMEARLPCRASWAWERPSPSIFPSSSRSKPGIPETGTDRFPGGTKGYSLSTMRRSSRSWATRC